MGTCRTHTNSQGTSMQPPAGPSTPMAMVTLLAPPTPPVPAKPLPQHMKFDLRPLNDNGNNYTQWCKMITLMLKYKGLWNIIDGSFLTLALTDSQGHLEWTQCDQEAQL